MASRWVFWSDEATDFLMTGIECGNMGVKRGQIFYNRCRGFSRFIVLLSFLFFVYIKKFAQAKLRTTDKHGSGSRLGPPCNFQSKSYRLCSFFETDNNHTVSDLCIQVLLLIQLILRIYKNYTETLNNLHIF